MFYMISEDELIRLPGRLYKVREISVSDEFISSNMSYFCRTGKRDLTGMLNDGVNSLARYVVFVE